MKKNNNILESNVLPTDSTKKVFLGGKVENLLVYKIPIDLLFYNSQNDRIATWISKHNVEDGNIDNLDVEQANEVIEDYIIKSNHDAYKKTKNNIKSFGQREPGVVLYDGRIIDGNRRFTCLRDLYRETNDDKYSYFEAVIIDKDISPKEIKMLELELQHGYEEKVDYNPIEKLVGIYNDIIKNEILTIEEYAKSIDVKLADMEKEKAKTELLIDFLNYINASEQFYIARELEIAGPLGEILNVKNKLKHDEDKWEKARIILFDYLLLRPKNKYMGDDITRVIRNINNDIINTELFDEYYENHKITSEEVNDIIHDIEIVDTNYIIDKIRGNESLVRNLSEHAEDILYKSKINKARNAPLEHIKTVSSDLMKVDLKAVSCLNSDDKITYKNELNNLKQTINEIEENLNETK